MTPLKKLKVLILNLIPVCFPVQLGKNLHSQVKKNQYKIMFKYKSSISSISSIKWPPCSHLGFYSDNC